MNGWMHGWVGGHVNLNSTFPWLHFLETGFYFQYSSTAKKKKKMFSEWAREKYIHIRVYFFLLTYSRIYLRASFPSLAPFQGLSISTKCRVNSWSSGVMDLGSHRAAACVKSHTAHLVFLRKAVENCQANEAALTEREERKQAGGNYWLNMKETEKEAGTIRERLCDTLKWISGPGRSQFGNHIGERCLLLCVKPQSWGIWNNMRFMAASEDDHNGSDKSLQI